MSYNKKTGLYEGYIYKITNNINGKLYIGQTMTDVNNRWRQHKYCAIHKIGNSIIHKAMTKYGIDNFQIIQISSYGFSNLKDLKQKLNDVEICLISKYNSVIPNGYNISKGGQLNDECGRPIVAYNFDGSIHKKYNSLKEAAIDNNCTYGCISECCRGLHSYVAGFVWRYDGDLFNKYPLIIKNMSITHSRKDTSPVVQYDKSTKEVINTFNSIKDACLYMNYDYPRESYRIANMCRGLVTSDVSEYVWRYVGDEFDKYRLHNKKCQKIDVYDMNGVFIQTFDSIVEGARVLCGTDDTSGINKCCKGIIKYSHGYIWKYHNSN